MPSLDHVAFAQHRDQLSVDVEAEHLGVHRAVDNPRGVQAVMAQGRDEGLGAPMAERHVVYEALAARRPARRLGHAGLDRGLVDERQSFQILAMKG